VKDFSTDCVCGWYALYTSHRDTDSDKSYRYWWGLYFV